VIFISFMWLLGIALLIWGATAIYGHFNKVQRELRIQHMNDLDIRGELRVQLYDAERTLREIANGAGNPALEAQIYLDKPRREIDV